jgi:hypothetical protein
MPSDDSDYEPAVEAPTPAVEASEAPIVPVEKIGAIDSNAIDDPQAGPRAPRVWSGKSREAFRKVVELGGVGEEAELEPMGAEPEAVTPAATPAAVAPSVVAAPVLAVAAAPVVPVAPPPGMPALPSVPLPAIPGVAPAAPAPDPKLAEREAAIAAREALLVEREKLLPDRTALVERPADAIMGWLRDIHGSTDDGELKTALTDLVTELSERGLGVKLPDEVKTQLESRKGLRALKAYKAQLDQREAKFGELTKAQQKAAAEAAAKVEQERQVEAYVANIGQLIAPARAQHPYLHDLDITEGIPAEAIVFDVLKAQQELGQKPDLATATEHANNFYKRKFDAAAKVVARYQTPAPQAPAAAKPATSPGGATGPAPTKPAAQAAKEPVWDPSDLPMDGQTRRRASLAKLVAKAKSRGASA